MFTSHKLIQYVVFLLLVLCTTTSVAVTKNDTHIRSLYSEQLAMQSSKADWASLTFNDGEWKSIAQYGLPAQQTQYWIRNHLTVASPETH